jgi:hypothetical protein
MAEFTITIETPEGTTTDEGLLGRFHDAINDDPVALRPSARLDVPHGVILSTFQVRAESLEKAQTIGIRAFVDALTIAGLEGEGLWHIVEADEEP